MIEALVCNRRCNWSGSNYYGVSRMVAISDCSVASVVEATNQTRILAILLPAQGEESLGGIGLLSCP